MNVLYEDYVLKNVFKTGQSFVGSHWVLWATVGLQAVEPVFASRGVLRSLSAIAFLVLRYLRKTLFTLSIFYIRNSCIPRKAFVCAKRIKTILQYCNNKLVKFTFSEKDDYCLYEIFILKQVPAVRPGQHRQRMPMGPRMNKGGNNYNNRSGGTGGASQVRTFL